MHIGAHEALTIHTERETEMNKNTKPTRSAAKKLTVEDLKRVIGGLGNHLMEPTVEGTEVEDTNGNKATGSGAKAD